MKTMLDILKERLPEGLEVVKVKDKASAMHRSIKISLFIFSSPLNTDFTT